MTTFAERRDGPGQRSAERYRRVPWSPRAWSQALYLAGGIPAQLAALFLVMAGFGAKHNWPLGLVFLVVVFLTVPLLTAMHRHRLRVTAGVEIPPQPAISNRLSPVGLAAAVRSQATWRQLGYHLLVAPVLAAAAIAAFGMWLAGVRYSLVFAYAWVTPSDGLFHRGTFAHSYPSFGIPVDFYLTAGGVVLLLLAPRFSALVGTVDAWAARTLLGPSRAEQLEHKVEHLTQTRAGVVDAADAERRRLERDLHDGTQRGWHVRDQQPGRRTDDAHGGPAMRTVATPGRWVWGVSGVVTAAVLAVPLTLLIGRAGTPGNANGVFPQRVASRTVTIPQVITGMTVDSYGAPVQVRSGDVSRVQVTEQPMYDPAGEPPAVTQIVSGGHLTLADPACADSGCEVAFTVTTPADVTATVSSGGGPVAVSGVKAATLDSGGGPVSAQQISGPLTISSDGGPILADGVVGTLIADSNGGSATVRNITAANVSVSTEGGPALVSFAAPKSVAIRSGGAASRTLA